MKKTLIVCVVSTLLSASCGPKTLSPEEQKQVGSLKAERSSAEGNITDSQLEEAHYSGGLIKS